MKQLKPLLEYIYRGECNMQQENLDEFLNTGKYLLVTSLTQEFYEKTEHEDIKSGFKEEALPNKDIDLKALPEDANEDMFQCKRCNYTTRFAHNLTKHFNAKLIAEPVDSKDTLSSCGVIIAAVCFVCGANELRVYCL